jgi:hypothetical protein
VGRWLSEDPISFSAGDNNLYRYSRNQPTFVVDPTGLFETVPGNMTAAQRATLEETERETGRRIGLWLNFLNTVAIFDLEQQMGARQFRQPEFGRKLDNFKRGIANNLDLIRYAIAESRYTLKVDPRMNRKNWAETNRGSGGRRVLAWLGGGSGGRYGRVGSGVVYISFNSEKFFKEGLNTRCGVFADEMSHYACQTSQDQDWVQPTQNPEASVGVDRIYFDMVQRGENDFSVRSIFWEYVNMSITKAIQRQRPRG